MGTLLKAFVDYYIASFHGRKVDSGFGRHKKFHSAVKLLNTFLEGNGFVTGTQELTITYLALFSSVFIGIEPTRSRFDESSCEKRLRSDEFLFSKFFFFIKLVKFG